MYIFIFLVLSSSSSYKSIYDCAPEKSYVTGIKDGESGAKMFGLSIIRTNNKNLSEVFQLNHCFACVII